MCDKCNQTVRETAYLLFSLTFKNWASENVLHCLATMYASMQRDCMEYGGNASDLEALWKVLVDKEFKAINHTNPIEPKQFEADYDFRKHFNSD